MTIAVYYLARAAEGTAPLDAFAASYRRHPAGAPHDLVLLCKGAETPEAVASVSARFAGIPHRAVPASDAGFDIQAYLGAARTATADRLCFLNTFSQIEADDWLLKLSRALDDPGVGIAGATASFESLRSTRALIEYLRWLLLMRGTTLPPDEAERAYWLLRPHLAGRRRSPRNWQDRLGSLLFARQPPGPDVMREYGAFRRDHAPLARIGEIDDFPLFPNPHLRSNAMMIDRERLLGFGFAVPPTKVDCFRFESGAGSLTRRVEAQGLAAAVVGADGAVFAPSDWPASRTFRSGDQSNLLVSDNQTRRFDVMPAPLREVFARVTWGDEPDQPPFVGVPFSRNARPLSLPDSGEDFTVDREQALRKEDASARLDVMAPSPEAVHAAGSGKPHRPASVGAPDEPVATNARQTGLGDARDRYVLALPDGGELTPRARRRLRRMQILSFVAHQERRLRWPLSDGGGDLWRALSWPERAFATFASYLHIESMSGRFAGWAYHRLLRALSPSKAGLHRRPDGGVDTVLTGGRSGRHGVSRTAGPPFGASP